ncbi:MAG TPA: nicotinate phosphoribosyltransferase [Methylocella sp.]|nr:nicotinate phosphoribosyltransferase [Methylocella sp.]
MDSAAGPLLIDLYQLTMVEAYLENEQTQTAVFEFFVRTLPPRRGFLLAAGLEQAIEYFEGLRFSTEDLAWLAKQGQFKAPVLDWLTAFRFTGDVHAIPEGTPFFANEPILRVTASLPQAQLVETRLINILHFQSLVASKAARMVLAAPQKSLVDFGLRRAHGAEAGLMAARASYIAGFDGTATVLAGKLFGIPLYGTMAHSFVQIYDDESTAFEEFARSCPGRLILLIDTYDTEAAAHKAVTLAPRFRAAGLKIDGVRLDSGDIAADAFKVRKILDEGSLKDVAIFASGGLDEDGLRDLIRKSAPIDGYGIGTSLVTSSDAPALDCAYKLEEYGGLARRKRSAGKATWPGRKQVWRGFSPDGRMAGDVVSIEGDRQNGEPLLQPVMIAGKRIAPPPSLKDIRERTARQLARLPEPLRLLETGGTYPVRISGALADLAQAVDRRLRQKESGQ